MITYRSFSFVCGTALMLASVGCQSAAQFRQPVGPPPAALREMSAWRDAESQDTIGAYEAYLAAYPTGGWAEEARMRIEEVKNDAERLNELEKIGIDLTALRQFIQKYPTGTRKSAAILARQRLEDLIIDSIRKEGPGNRFVIEGIIPVAGQPTGSCTIKRLNKSLLALGLDYPKDRVPSVNGIPVAPTGAGSVMRFRGPYGDFFGHMIEGDVKEPLAFVLLDGMGMVYVTGKGKVTLKNGTLVTLPAVASP